ncbi:MULTISPECIES: hypothetical protein [unclassified Brevundimonas]|uniref:hypothetical protein n=1 Tax=unclassified Brevundimonas TaxID=2622653 RepID=UPI0025C669B9|nr:MULTISPECIES: hypothetical protein [unclassified Brevundimonas]
MTPDELHAAIDAMQADAGYDDRPKPGLITIQSDEWIERLYAESAKPKTIADGIRIRDIKVAISADATTAVLTREEAGDRGEPYREPQARA